MNKTRLEAFSDGVFAIIITIMVLELKAPHEADLASLRPLLPVFGSYAFSFVIVAIYWNSHHNLFHAVERIDGRVLWHNLHALFWLSLIPLATAWLGEYPLGRGPTAFYGLLLTMEAVAFRLLLNSLVDMGDANQHLRRSTGRDRKGLASLLLALAGTVSALFAPWLAHVFFWAVALIWFVPDRRMAKG